MRRLQSTQCAIVLVRATRSVRRGKVGLATAKAKFVLYATDGRLVFENNTDDRQRDRLVSTIALPPGWASVGYAFTPDKARSGRKSICDEL